MSEAEPTIEDAVYPKPKLHVAKDGDRIVFTIEREDRPKTWVSVSREDALKVVAYITEALGE